MTWRQARLLGDVRAPVAQVHIITLPAELESVRLCTSNDGTSSTLWPGSEQWDMAVDVLIILGFQSFTKVWTGPDGAQAAQA